MMRQHSRRSPRLKRRPAAKCGSARTHRDVVLLIVLDLLLAGVFLTAALLAQPAVATIAGTACVTVTLQITRQSRP